MWYFEHRSAAYLKYVSIGAQKDHVSQPIEMSFRGSLLKALGINNVATAFNSSEAVEAMQQQKMDLILTDWDLSGGSNVPAGYDAGLMRLADQKILKSGADFVRFTRGSPRSPNPYACVIMLTSMALAENVEYARDAGVNEVLAKPLAAEDLCKRVITAVERECPFITASRYKGPCRRRKKHSLASGIAERRLNDIQIIRFKS